jgi:hypothetical protein
MTETRAKYAEHLQHDDLRVQAILILAQFAVDCVPTPAPLTEAAAAILRHVDPKMSKGTFHGIVTDLESADDYDTRGGEAVVDNFGGWSGTDYLTADEKASEMRDKHRANARSIAEMLVELDDRS